MSDVIDYCRALAIADSLNAGGEAQYRYICRQYSKTFHTPLHLVYSLDAEEVIRAFYENQMDDLDIDDSAERLLDIIYGIEDPNYAATKESEASEFLRQAVEEERERIKAKRPIHPGMRFDSEVSTKNTSEKATVSDDNKPTGGSIDLSYLSEEENER